MTTPLEPMLEPLPTKKLAALEPKARNVDIHIDQQGSGDQKESVYPWLLGASTCLSIALCWLYVTKPVIASDSVTSVGVHAADVSAEGISSSSGGSATSSEGGVGVSSMGNLDTANLMPDGQAVSELIPSDNSLPGEAGSKVNASGGLAGNLAGNLAGGLTNLMSSGSVDDLQLSGWEKTNLKVQHILSADSGNGEIEKIVMDVPVFYQTRSMRWTPQNVASARGILKKLMIYEGNLSKLKSEGESLLEEWNTLLADTVPEEALRADSPSLPYNHSRLNKSEAHADSEALIKIQN